MSSKKLTILFTPLDGWGHINACHGIAEKLRDRGHRVVFAIDIGFKDKLIKFGFEEELHSEPRDVADDFWANFILRFKHVFKLRPIDIVKTSIVEGFTLMFDSLRSRDSQYADIIDRVKPDVIVIDSYVGSPTLTDSGIPWVLLYSAAPHLWYNMYDNDKVPPGWSGLGLNSSKSEWKEFRTEFETIFTPLHNKIIDWYKSRGVTPDMSRTLSQLHPESKHLNVYMYPKELDYSHVQQLPQNYRRVDGFVRTTNEKFSIPESIRDRPGKLVFLTMGSYGCSILELMTRVTGILAKSEHRFIVSKGPLHEQFELPANMWGQQFVPQTAVLPVVDLVITHGGNNTFTETFFFGKPMLVLPMFGDQFDNAQRLTEKGLGARLSPFFCTEEELLTTVDRLVNDLELKQKMKDIGERIRNSKDKEVIAELIENIVLND